jgi:hypothetical protein
MTTIQLFGLKEGLEDVGKMVAAHALENMYSDIVEHAPKDTGKMADTIKIDFKNNQIVSPQPYTGYVEFGILKDPKNPMTDWEAKRKRGGKSDQTMPFIRPAIYRYLSYASGLSPNDWARELEAYRIRIKEYRGDIDDEGR